MHTINGAYVLRQEEVTGSVVVGKEADLIVLDRDPFEMRLKELDSVKVLQTLVSGKEVFRSPDF